MADAAGQAYVQKCLPQCCHTALTEETAAMEWQLLQGLAATQVLADTLARQLEPGAILLLHGELGAGKTSLVRALLAALEGEPDQVSSPTFTLLHQYEARIPVIHVDAYRLTDAAELLDIGFEELRESCIACVEWPCRVPDCWEDHCCWQVHLEHAGPEARLALVVPPSAEPNSHTIPPLPAPYSGDAPSSRSPSA